MTDKDINTICEHIESLHAKILKSKFAEIVTESEMLSLILAVKELNRQQAEISELQHKIMSCNSEIERLQKENHHFADIGKLYSEIRAEAVKEFAERLKNKKARYNADYFYVIDYIPLKEIDNLVKEMVGEG